jgi:membrane-bound hydrogenase subunit beta
MDAQSIAAELQSVFAFPEGALKVQRATRLWVDVDMAGFPAVFDHVVKSMGFRILCTITGLDLGQDLGFIYHLAHDCGIMVNVKTRSPKGSTLKSVTPYFPSAELYEREVNDLLGARIEGLPPGPRYPLPENWPEGEHPLLKDWTSKNAAPGEKGTAPNE